MDRKRSSRGNKIQHVDVSGSRWSWEGGVFQQTAKGTIRPAIAELAKEDGAYIIVSSRGSTSDRALGNRRRAMRKALNDVADADRLHTDFYDRTRLATWVRHHPGIITWVRAKVGRALVGWRHYGPWCSANEAVGAEYLLDDKLRLHLAKGHDALPVATAIDSLRDELAQPGKIVRLVGLSGVGKTRLVQALFDARIGMRALPPALAVYTNLADDPNPQPTGLASDLLANQTRAVLIVDNCPPDLHRRLSELCSGPTSTLSVITIEYDVRDDQPENTHVVTLDTSSIELIEKLVRRRFPHVSQVDAHTIAEVSGGNARIAIALAQTVEHSDTIAGLSNDELFQRLFRQRHDPDNNLLRAAQVCSLVYSFHGEALEGVEAELPRLASLAGQKVSAIYSHVGELLRRDLAQKRDVWRAILPHAIANRLAARALEDIPYEHIDQQLVTGGTERLARSFSRRLSFLHDHPQAVAIAGKWLAPDGLLGNVAVFNDLGCTMFKNVAPVLPGAALAALERVVLHDPDGSVAVWQRHQALLCSLAYDAPLFERSTHLLAQIATQSADGRQAQQAKDAFGSLFGICLSGTHATIEQRLGVIEELLKSDVPTKQELGLAALDEVLEATHFNTSHSFEFGARSRDFGYEPRTVDDVTHWYSAALTLIERLALGEGILKRELRDVVAKNFRSMWRSRWTSTDLYDCLDKLYRRFAADRFWRGGWIACRETMAFEMDRLTPEAASRLSALEADLKPLNLSERVQAFVLGNRSAGFDLADMDTESDPMDAFERLASIAIQLGETVATDERLLLELLPDLLTGEIRTWWFGEGLASASPEPGAVWTKLVDGFEQNASPKRSPQLLRGFLAKLWERDRNLAQRILDSVVDRPTMRELLPSLHAAVGLDERGVERLKQALHAGHTPARAYLNLAYGRATDQVEAKVLKDLLLLIADQPDGFDVALEILSMRLHSDQPDRRAHDPELLATSRELLRRATFQRHNDHKAYQLSRVVEACLVGPEGGPVAAEVVARIQRAVIARETYLFDNKALLASLLKVQPHSVLDALFVIVPNDKWPDLGEYELLNKGQTGLADAIPCETLIAWCEADRDRRYPSVAAIIPFAAHPKEGGPIVWSEQAKALLTKAPNPQAVLEVLIRRFTPRSWSGSLAALLETNARLLDNVESLVPPSTMAYVNEAKKQLAQEIAQVRLSETERDRSRDERFE